eukprot:RCo053084
MPQPPTAPALPHSSLFRSLCIILVFHLSFANVVVVPFAIRSIPEGVSSCADFSPQSFLHTSPSRKYCVERYPCRPCTANVRASAAQLPAQGKEWEVRLGSTSIGCATSHFGELRELCCVFPPLFGTCREVWKRRPWKTVCFGVLPVPFEIEKKK